MSLKSTQLPPVSVVTRYELKQIDPRPEQWDTLLQSFDTTTVFHRSGWLNFLQETQKGEIVRFEVVDASEVVGYFVAMIVRKGPFRILGSPLRGWGTLAMGPIADPLIFNTGSFLRALEQYCNRASIHLLELSCNWLQTNEFACASFIAARDITHSIDLSTVEAAWSGMYKTTRNYVRRAEKIGVTVERASSESAIYEHYEQLKAVFGRQGLVPPYGVDRPLAMWRALEPRGEITVLRAVHTGRCIATYVLVHDQNTMWGTATASEPQSLDLRPNELIHWRAIEMACEGKLKRYDFCGGGDYKKKYGAVEVPWLRYIKGRTRAAVLAYRGYERFWAAQRKASAFLRRLQP